MRELVRDRASAVEPEAERSRTTADTRQPPLHPLTTFTDPRAEQQSPPDACHEPSSVEGTSRHSEAGPPGAGAAGGCRRERSRSPGRVRPAPDASDDDAITYIELGPRRVVVAEPAMTRVFGVLERVARSLLPVLISGETGVGKDNAAYAVHHWSRRTGEFIAVNCAALGPESLIESELFGHDRGAFTGAVVAKPGLLESAAGGTVFLDEVGELPDSIQPKLLRALEAKRIVRLGETTERPIDVRIVAATNRSLDDEVKERRFRRDLYFRLRGATVLLPPLRDRRREIAMLARALLADACTRACRGPMTLSSEGMQVLLDYQWPGNVRELKNTLEYVAVTALGDRVEPSDLPDHLGGAHPCSIPPRDAAQRALQTETAFRPIGDEICELECNRMRQALAAAGGIRTRAARLIKMPIRTFTLRLKQYKL
jgi:two-component system response regulator AtoC